MTDRPSTAIAAARQSVDGSPISSPFSRIRRTVCRQSGTQGRNADRPQRITQRPAISRDDDVCGWRICSRTDFDPQKLGQRHGSFSLGS